VLVVVVVSLALFVVSVICNHYMVVYGDI
jgi:hypothetical protein